MYRAKRQTVIAVTKTNNASRVSLSMIDSVSAAITFYSVTRLRFLHETSAAGGSPPPAYFRVRLAPPSLIHTLVALLRRPMGSRLRDRHRRAVCIKFLLHWELSNSTAIPLDPEPRGC